MTTSRVLERRRSCLTDGTLPPRGLFAAVAGLLLAGALTGCDDPCAQCDARTESCEVTHGCAFLQNGNPNPLGEPDRATCRPLPVGCVETDGCACAVCPPDGDGDACVSQAACGEDGLLTTTFLCE